MKSHSQISEQMQGPNWLRHVTDKNYNQSYKEDWRELAREEPIEEPLNDFKEVYEENNTNNS